MILVHDEGTDFILCCGDDISDEKMFTVRLQWCVLCFVFRVSGSLITPILHFIISTPFESIYSDSLSFRTLPSWATSRMPSRFLPSLAAIQSLQDMQMSSPHIRDPMYCYTVAVGKKPSRASSWVNDAQAVAELLVTLSMGEQERPFRNRGDARVRPVSLSRNSR